MDPFSCARIDVCSYHVLLFSLFEIMDPTSNNMWFTRFPDAKFHHWPRNYKRVAQQLARGPAFCKLLLFSCMTRGHDDPIVGNAIGWVDSNI